MAARPPPPPNSPGSGSRPPPVAASRELASVEDEPDDPTRLMPRRPAAGQRAVDHAAIFNAPTKIIPRVRSGGVTRSLVSNLLAYTQRPSVNLALLLLAGLLLVGLGFVLGSGRKQPSDMPPPEPSVTKVAPASTIVRPVSLAAASAPVAAIAVSSLPLAPPLVPAKDLNAAGRSMSALHGASSELPLLPDRPPVADTAESKKGYIAPIRNPGF